MKDRIVEFPNRYRLVPVAGQNGVYDIEAVPGMVTEAGTPINKATLLSDATAALYGLTGDNANVDEALSMVCNRVSELKNGTTINNGFVLPVFIPFSTIGQNDCNNLDITNYPTRILVPSGVTRIKLTAKFYVTTRGDFGGQVKLYKNGELLKVFLKTQGTASTSTKSTYMEQMVEEILNVNGGDYFQLSADSYPSTQVGVIETEFFRMEVM